VAQGEGEVEFSVPVAGGTLRGHRGGDGPPALLLHGGPGLPDYTHNCAGELRGLLDVVRYTQRGVPPSEAPGPYSVEGHVDDALAVMDALGLEKAWACGHSWGGYLALNLAVRAPERVLGLILVAPLGVRLAWILEMSANLRVGLTTEQAARLDAIEEARRQGTVTEAHLVERWGLVWAQYFADPAAAPASPVTRVGVQASTETNASLGAALRAAPLEASLPALDLPCLVVHGVDDPMPVSGSFEICGLVRGALLEVVDACGHFPWLERPGALRDAVKDFLAEPSDDGPPGLSALGGLW
jgi:proline iminopeptidase